MRRNPRLGTRGSPLALAQARKVAAALETAQRWPAGYVEIVADHHQRRPDPGPAAGRGRRQGAVDQGARPRAAGRRRRFCVHSMKDVESERPAEIHIAAMRPRGDVRDRLIGADSIDALRTGRGGRHLVAAARGAAARASARPQDRADARQCRNPAARRSKRARSTRPCSSAAGLKRLGMDDIGVAVPVEVMLPAPGQAALGIECRTDDDDDLQAC